MSRSTTWPIAGPAWPNTPTPSRSSDLSVPGSTRSATTAAELAALASVAALAVLVALVAQAAPAVQVDLVVLIVLAPIALAPKVLAAVQRAAKMATAGEKAEDVAPDWTRDACVTAVTLTRVTT